MFKTFFLIFLNFSMVTAAHSQVLLYYPILSYSMLITLPFVYFIPFRLSYSLNLAMVLRSRPTSTPIYSTFSYFLPIPHGISSYSRSQREPRLLFEGEIFKPPPPPTKGAQLVTETSAALFSPTFGRLYHGLFNHLIIVVKNSKNKLSWKMAKHIYLSVVQFGFFRHSRRFFLFYSKTTLNREDESSQYKTKN